MASTRVAPLPLRDVKVAVEVWVATALLHREQPDRTEWSIDEIVQRIEREKLYPTLRPGVRSHVTLHCVANRPPNPAKLRMLYATNRSERRLYKPDDPASEGRTGHITPLEEEMPQPYRYLLSWYEQEYAKQSAGDGWLSGLKAMQGLGKGIYTGVDPDQYVRELREGWD